MPFGLKLPTFSSNTLDSLTTKVQEATNKVVESFGGTGPFKKVAAIGPQLNESAAETARLLRQAVKTAPDQVAAETERLLRQATSTVAGSLTHNAMSFSAARDSQAASEASVSATSQNLAIGNSEPKDHRVTLEEIGSNNSVIFRVMPEIAESRNAKYDAVAPPQSPGAFQKYMGTESVQWQLNATLTCRTTAEASENLRIINQLRAWTMPYFGENTRRFYPTKIGAPPPVLKFSAYRNQMVGPVPVVLTSVQWQFTQDVDYIPAQEQGGSELIPFPTVMKVALQLVESFSTDQFNGFDLAEFRLGNSEAAWMSLPGQGMNDGAGTGLQGGAVAPEEAGEIAPNEARRLSNYGGPSANGVLGGRGSVGGPTAEELNAYRTQVARDSIRGQRGYGVGVAVTERVDHVAKIESGQEDPNLPPSF